MVKQPGQAAIKQMSLKKEFVIFMSIPASIVILVAVILLVPQLLARPSFDFIYSYCPSYDCSSYLVQNGTVTQDNTPIGTDSNSTPDGGQTQPQLYYYNVHANSASRITLGQANMYNLDSANVSPDGYTLTQGNTSDNGFLFWGSSYDGNWYLKNGLKKKLLNIGNGASYYDNNLQLLGWIRK